MTTPLLVAVTVVAVALALLGVLSTALRRRIGTAHLVGAGLLQLLVLALAGVAVAELIGGHRPTELATFLGYLASVVLLPLAGVLWARTDPTRWAGTIIAVTAAAVAVMVWRLDQVWQVTGG
ncbi:MULTISPECIES: hypothetical protein [unclassified Modestobacter]